MLIPCEMLTACALTDIANVDVNEASPRSVDSVEDLAILQRWKEECDSLARGHSRAFHIYKTLNNTATFLSIGLSASTGIASLSLTAVALGPVAIVPIIVGASGIIVGSIVALAKGMGFEAKMHEHNQQAAEYAEVARDIRQEHTLRRLGHSQYSSVSEFIKVVSDKMDRMEAAAAAMPC
jgi:hypothetical protein